MPQSSLRCACSLHPVLLALDATAPSPFWEGPGLRNQEEPKRRLSGGGGEVRGQHSSFWVEAHYPTFLSKRWGTSVPKEEL